ncbi:unnamed protein product [Didymodactylos carnosus]|uniref:Uncharacterized protein n=1 Tax=Didymodactylos carnosus TaxID=1234261 RepID=A0A816CUI6_9BILA|nr:unnamed protein product [Didymodactylos carnosus]CAF4527580.1 unnamed protein product [Didymodactylos carnosus]
MVSTTIDTFTSPPPKTNSSLSASSLIVSLSSSLSSSNQNLKSTDQENDEQCQSTLLTRITPSTLPTDISRSKNESPNKFGIPKTGRKILRAEPYLAQNPGSATEHNIKNY